MSDPGKAWQDKKVFPDAVGHGSQYRGSGATNRITGQIWESGQSKVRRPASHSGESVLPHMIQQLRGLTGSG